MGLTAKGDITLYQAPRKYDTKGRPYLLLLPGIAILAPDRVPFTRRRAVCPVL